jgi:hypothetical protein
VIYDNHTEFIKQEIYGQDEKFVNVKVDLCVESSKL